MARHMSDLKYRETLAKDLLRQLFETAPDPTGFDKTAPGYAEAWNNAQAYLGAED
jgi:hypothetical protein